MNLQRRLRELNIYPKKRLGQHFVVDERVLSRIVAAAALDGEEIVLEIGAGLGNLTACLAGRAKKVYALEIDPRLIEPLRQQFAGNEKVEIIPGDAMQFAFGPLARIGQRKLKVVANLPYEISSPMLFRLLEERENFSLFVLMLQLEVARRIVAKPGTKEYGPLALWSELYTQARILFTVPPNAFHPRPKVESAVVRFEVLDRPSVDVAGESGLREVIRSAFTYRRKTLVNALRLGGFAHLSPQKIQEVLTGLGIDPLVRGEELQLAQFCTLARTLASE